MLLCIGSANLLTTHARQIPGENELRKWDAGNFTARSVELPDGTTVNYRAYENIYYVANVKDSTYQYLNLYVPETVYTTNRKAPIFLKTNIGGYRAAKAGSPSGTDATGRALREGYVVVCPGARGSDSTVTGADGATVYTGRVPAGVVDLKAAIRYLRHIQAELPGDTERIITDGTSAGGAMSALVGATGNHPAYDPYLQELGAANERDDVFAAVCYCPITDLEHADMAYEWLYQPTNTKGRNLSPTQIEVSNELAALYPAYLNSLELQTPDGELLTDSNYRDYLKSFLIASAQKAKDFGAELPENAGIVLNQGSRGSQGNYVIDLDLDSYLEYVVGKQALKTPPAFDALNVLGAKATPENNAFGDETGSAVNFTGYSLRKATGDPSANFAPTVRENVYLMNPMNFIGDRQSTTTNNWYIRHGAIDRDTGFEVPVNLYTKLVNHGYNANFALAWNRPHSGDYNLDDLFEWLARILEEAEKNNSK